MVRQQEEDGAFPGELQVIKAENKSVQLLAPVRHEDMATV